MKAKRNLFTEVCLETWENFVIETLYKGFNTFSNIHDLSMNIVYHILIKIYYNKIAKFLRT